MAARSAVSQLPEAVLKDLDGRLVSSGFSNYAGLAKWLADQGYEISKSALHRYGSKFEERVAQLKLATSQAKAIVEAAPDDENAVSDALLRLVQEKLFQLLVEADIDPAEPINLAKTARAIADLGRTGISLKKYQAEVRARLAATVGEMAQAQGMGEEQQAYWMKRFLGVAA